MISVKLKNEVSTTMKDLRLLRSDRTRIDRYSSEHLDRSLILFLQVKEQKKSNGVSGWECLQVMLTVFGRPRRSLFGGAGEGEGRRAGEGKGEEPVLLTRTCCRIGFTFV